jgi:predicted Holliday junction resolvase-like endonuclease
MQEIFVIFVAIGIMLVAAMFFIALIYLYQQLKATQEKNETLIKNYETKLQDINTKHQLDTERARQQSVAISRRTIKGQIAEQFAPILTGFPYLPSDSHFIGDPIDYIVFNGYTNFKDNHTNSDIEVVIVDIKHNNARLSDGQKQIAKAIEAGMVRFETIRISDDGTIETHSWDSKKGKEIVALAESQSIEIPANINILPPNSEIQPSESLNNAFKNWYAFLQKYPNAYEPWNIPDDELLTKKYAEGMKIKEIALLLKRNPGKIRLRLKEKGLLKTRK